VSEGYPATPDVNKTMSEASTPIAKGIKGQSKAA
jgi:hypothetical protein